MEISDFPRLAELRSRSKNLVDEQEYFQGFEEIVSTNETAAKKYALLEQELQELHQLDPGSWEVLIGKARNYLAKSSPLRGWQQLFEALNEAKGYCYLSTIGCLSINFIPEDKKPTPDLEATDAHKGYLLEVKTINISDNEVRTRKIKFHAREVKFTLDENLLIKIDKTIQNAFTQLLGYRVGENLERIVLLVVNFDENKDEAQPTLIKELESFIDKQNYQNGKVVVKSAN